MSSSTEKDVKLAKLKRVTFIQRSCNNLWESRSNFVFIDIHDTD